MDWGYTNYPGHTDSWTGDTQRTGDTHTHVLGTHKELGTHNHCDTGTRRCMNSGLGQTSSCTGDTQRTGDTHTHVLGTHKLPGTHRPMDCAGRSRKASRHETINDETDRDHWHETETETFTNETETKTRDLKFWSRERDHVSRPNIPAKYYSHEAAEFLMILKLQWFLRSS